MIVMKFGGTSVESAAAIERVASIVKAARGAPARGGGLGHGQDHQQAAGHRAVPLDRRPAGRSLEADRRSARISPARGAGRSFRKPTGPRRSASSTSTSRNWRNWCRGLRVLGELSPRSVDAISSYGERLSSALVALAFRKFGMDAVHVDSRQVMITDARHTQAAPLYPDTYARLARHGGAAGAREGCGHGRLHRLHRERRRPPRWAAAAPTSAPPSWARASAPRRSRSGPTWTAC